MNYLIISGGKIDSEFACEIIKNGGFEVIIAADSGMNFLYKNKINPDIILGDFDSVNDEALDYFKSQPHIEIVALIPEKDDTDTEHAVRFAIERGADDITILGGTGSRLDHMLGNISALGIGLENGVKIQLVDRNNRVRLLDSSFSLKKDTQFGDYVSLIPFMGPVRGLTLKGMKYELDNYELGGFNSLGVSNEIVDDCADIIFSEGYLLVIESRDK